MELDNPASIINYFDIINKNINRAFFIYDVECKRLVYLNGSFEKLVNNTFAELQENPSIYIELIHPDDRDYVLSTLNNVDALLDKKSIEFRIFAPDKSIKWVCLTFHLHKGPEEEEVMIGFAEDITKSKAYSFNLLKYNSKKNATLNILSHDLASPMNNIQQIAELLDKRLKKYNDQEVEKLVKLIKKTCKNGVDLIQDFVAQEFLESSEVDLVKKRLDLVEKIGIIMDNYKMEEKAIKKTFHFTHSSPNIFAKVDDMKFMQVINNLISNAIKFTPDHGIISLHIEENEDKVIISIKDNGIGIPKHLHEYLFDKFTKARRPGLKGEKSIGLGMSIVKTIIDWHSGKIWFESEEKKGTSFYIEIDRE